MRTRIEGSTLSEVVANLENLLVNIGFTKNTEVVPYKFYWSNSGCYLEITSAGSDAAFKVYNSNGALIDESYTCNLLDYGVGYLDHEVTSGGSVMIGLSNDGVRPSTYEVTFAAPSDNTEPWLILGPNMFAEAATVKMNYSVGPGVGKYLTSTSMIAITPFFSTYRFYNSIYYVFVGPSVVSGQQPIVEINGTNYVLYNPQYDASTSRIMFAIPL